MKRELDLLNDILTELTKLREAVQGSQGVMNPVLIVNVHADQDAQELAESIRRELDKLERLR